MVTVGIVRGGEVVAPGESRVPTVRAFVGDCKLAGTRGRKGLVWVPVDAVDGAARWAELLSCGVCEGEAATDMTCWAVVACCPAPACSCCCCSIELRSLRGARGVIVTPRCGGFGAMGIGLVGDRL